MHSECRNPLEYQNESMMLDGWSNVHNEPIVCASVTTPDGQSYLINENMGRKWYALGYEPVYWWLRTGILLVTKRYGTKRFGYKTSRNQPLHGCRLCPVLKFLVVIIQLENILW